LRSPAQAITRGLQLGQHGTDKDPRILRRSAHRHPQILNYLGAITRFVALQAEHDCLYCVVDLHAITVFQDPDELAKNTREVTAAFIAAGIDPAKHIVFNQSQVAAHAELLGVQLRRPHRLAQPHDPVQGEGR
jgi:tryptophanyl-tRNA synthetase